MKQKKKKEDEVKVIPNDSMHPPERMIDDEIKKLLVKRLKLDPNAVVGIMYRASVVFGNDEKETLIEYFHPDLWYDLCVQYEEVLPGFNGGKCEWYEMKREDK